MSTSDRFYVLQPFVVNRRPLIDALKSYVNEKNYPLSGRDKRSRG